VEALLDNDLIYKLTRYGLLHEFERLLVAWGYDAPHKRVASAPFSLRTTPANKVSATMWPDPSQVDVLRAFCFQRSSGATGSQADALSALNVPKFDAGEVQLVAYAIDHRESVVFTGDKRAVMALSQQPPLIAAKAALTHRVIHLNSVMYALSERLGWTRVAAAVAGAQVDTELTAIYRGPNENTMATELRASIERLRNDTPDLLVPSL
jgi:hypothetical protein